MSMQVETSKRLFKYKEHLIEEPGSDLTPEEVKELLSDQWPELITASISGPQMSEDGETATYTFEQHIGTKG